MAQRLNRVCIDLSQWDKKFGLMGNDNKTFWHFVTEFPRLRIYREEAFLDEIPQQNNWKISSVMNIPNNL